MKRTQMSLSIRSHFADDKHCPRLPDRHHRGLPGFGRLRWLLVVLTSLSVGCGDTTQSVTQVEEAIPDLEAETFEIRRVKWPMLVRVQGSLYSDEVSAVGARVSGRVGQVHVELGDTVVAGEPLVTIQQDEFELLLAQAEAQLAQARSAVGLSINVVRETEGEAADLELVDHLDPVNSPPVRRQRAVWDEAQGSLRRADKLLAQGAISSGEHEEVAAAERVAEALYSASINSVEEKLALIGVRRVELALARQRLDDAVIRAPFDGLVQSRSVAPGSYVRSGDAVVAIVRTDPIWFHGTVPERYASRLRTGLEIKIGVESAAQPVVATVTRISPSIDLASRSLAFEAKIDNHDGKLRSGVFANADLVLDPEAESLVIPVEAITEFAGSEKVWKLIEGVATQLEITTGGERAGWVEVIDGLTGGEMILSNASVGRVARVVSKGEPVSRIVGGDGPGETDTTVSRDRRRLGELVGRHRGAVAPGK